MSTARSQSQRASAAGGNTARSNRTLWLVLAACLLPFLAATALYIFAPPKQRMNYGELIEPMLLPDIGLSMLDGKSLQLADLRGKWVMLQVDESSCERDCREKLYNMRQVRLTQGKNMERILRLWVVRDEGPIDPALLTDYEGTLVVRAGKGQWLQKLSASGSVHDPIWLVDPLGNIMLRYPLHADPSGMKNDLARLLKVSRIQ